MVCSAISSIESFSDFMVWPTTCNFYFYLIILGAVFIILAWTLFKEEERRKNEGDMISALGTSAIAISILSSIGTLVKNNSNIPMIPSQVLLIVISVTVAIVLIWIFKKD